MKCWTATEMRQADQDTITAGTSGIELMGRASRSLAGELYFYADGCARPVLVVAGIGNNGGDGFGLALHLERLGWPVEVWIAGKDERIQGDARCTLEKLKAGSLRILWKPEAADWEFCESNVPPGAWIVDALLGTGAQGSPRGVVASAIRTLQHLRGNHRIWAVDSPSGLDVDTGKPVNPECCVRAHATLSLGGPKKGFLAEESLEWTGPVSVLEIGLEFRGSADPEEWQILTDREVRSALPQFRPDEHKGSRGHALFLGGSPGMSGAISLAALSALRSGAGLVSVLTPISTAPGIDAAHQEVMVIPGKQGKFMTLSPQDVSYTPYQVACVGPGLRVDPDTVELVRRTLQECPHPLVIDADGLKALAQIGIRVGDFRRPVFLTPHPGEMALLLETRSSRVQEDRCSAVIQAGALSHAHVVLKGAHSRIATPKGGRWLNTSGNAALATAGTGDILAGILTGLIARGTSLDVALAVSVYLHGRAGELASIRKGVSSVIAGDVVEALPAVFRHAEGR